MVQPLDEDELSRLLASDDRIAYALLFGSYARGEGSPLSDLDIAIGLRRGQTFDVHSLGTLSLLLQRATGREIDLVVVDGASPGLAYRIFRDGRLILETDRSVRIEHEVRAILDYLDFAPVERFCARAVLETAARG